LRQLENLVKRIKPDLVIIDPLFAFVGTDVSKQQEVTGFLRQGLQPLLEKYNFGAVISHHTNKPPSSKRERPDWANGDFAYAGSGSAEIANWMRGVIALRRPSEDDEIFELVFGKRHQKTGLRDKDGKFVRRIAIKHSPDPTIICWVEGTEDDWPERDKQKVNALWSAVEQAAVDGVAKKGPVAKAMATSGRTLNRMFERGPVLVTRPGKPTVRLEGGKAIIKVTVLTETDQAQTAESWSCGNGTTAAVVDLMQLRQELAQTSPSQRAKTNGTETGQDKG
jgi:hypothetical protein